MPNQANQETIRVQTRVTSAVCESRPTSAHYLMGFIPGPRRRSGCVRRKLILLSALLLPAWAGAQTGSAEGRMVVNGKERMMKYARAANVPSETDRGEMDLRIIVSDEPVPAKAIFEEMSLFEASSAGAIHAVQIKLTGGGAQLGIWSQDTHGYSYSHSQSPNPYAIKVSEGRVEGEVHEKERWDNFALELAVKFSAPIEKFVPEAEPTPTDTEAAKRNPAANAYLALQDAVRNGDRARIRAAAPPEAAAQIDGPDFAEMLTGIQAMQHKELLVRKAVEKDGETTLWVAGKTPEGKAATGKVVMRLEADKWIMRSESWK